jgi:hypothetical protein
VPPHICADIANHLDSFTDADPESLLFRPSVAAAICPAR